MRIERYESNNRVYFAILFMFALLITALTLFGCSLEKYGSKYPPEEEIFKDCNVILQSELGGVYEIDTTTTKKNN